MTVIDKIAAAFNRTGQDLVVGTDREGYYIAQGLSPEQAAHVQQERKVSVDLVVVTLRATYERLVKLFEALHAGPYIVAETRGEEIYLGIRSACESLLGAFGADAPELFFPDHFEIVDEDDVNSWDLMDQPELRKSLLALRHLEHARNPDPAVYEYHEQEQQHRSAVDAFIERLREYQGQQNHAWEAEMRRRAERVRQQQ